jgi:hypothetical protein
MSPNVEAAIKYVSDRSATEGVEFVRKKELREALGLKSAPALNLTVLNSPDWQDFLKDAGLTMSRQKIERVACGSLQCPTRHPKPP